MLFVNTLTDLRGPSLLTLQQKCENVRCIIIDEISMIGCKLLNAVDRRLRQAFPNKSDTSFGGCSVIVLGDFGQLPPVADSRLFRPNTNNANSSHGHAAYLSFNKVFFLTECVRQADDNAFRDLLLRLRDGQTTMEDYNNLATRFQGRVIDEVCI